MYGKIRQNGMMKVTLFLQKQRSSVEILHTKNQVLTKFGDTFFTPNFFLFLHQIFSFFTPNFFFFYTKFFAFFTLKFLLFFTPKFQLLLHQVLHQKFGFSTPNFLLFLHQFCFTPKILLFFTPNFEIQKNIFWKKLM